MNKANLDPSFSSERWATSQRLLSLTCTHKTCTLKSQKHWAFLSLAVMGHGELVCWRLREESACSVLRLPWGCRLPARPLPRLLCLALQRDEHRVSSLPDTPVDGPARGEAGHAGLRSSQQLHKDARRLRAAFVAVIRLGSAEY